MKEYNLIDPEKPSHKYFMFSTQFFNIKLSEL